LDLSSQWELRVIANSDTAINNLSVIHPGGTVNFVEVTDDDKVFTGYCTAVSSLSIITTGSKFSTPDSLFRSPASFTRT
jgi:hypothetical protein